jgi:ABC-type polysaccharide/polyol phosphate transport system ATPase subunit
MSENVIEVRDVSMTFNLADDNVSALKEYVVKLLKGQLKYTEFKALTDVSLTVKKGGVLGIIGDNGAGKSTLLKIISGVLKPTSGSVYVNGTVAPMLELGAGFDTELSAKENVFLNGAILGYTEEFIKSKYGDIMDFSELWDFANVPVRNFSSGMVARLAFSIATLVTPEILIVDEVLSVGDEGFRRKSEAKMLDMMRGGATVIFVSHNINQISELSSEVLWLERGRVKMLGDPREVCVEYIRKWEN